jgi:hypothetical protein
VTTQSKVRAKAVKIFQSGLRMARHAGETTVPALGALHGRSGTSDQRRWQESFPTDWKPTRFNDAKVLFKKTDLAFG